ncbi:MAG TPA: condensation domain-containing protein, partial [Pyrinomonadaceae bacterium]
RIEPGEIERALAEHASVADALVVLREDEGEKRLVAYLVLNGTRAPVAGELRRHLKERLPEYMMPSAFVLLDALPLTPGGKVDMRALPAPDRTRLEVTSDFVSPRNELEHRLARIWADVLKLERVGVEDNFFELGGDSILTIQAIARAQAEGLSLTARQMFTHPTVAELAALAVTAHDAQALPAPSACEVPLTPGQRRLFAQEPESFDGWTAAVLLEVERHLSQDELTQALIYLVNHHEALRLRFTRDDAGWRQHITQDARGQLRIDVSDLSATAEAEQPAAIEAICAEAQTQLSLSEGPLLRAVLFERGAGRAPRLLLVASRLMVDRASWPILLEDLSKLCEQSQRSERLELATQTASFKSCVLRLEQHAASDDPRAATAYRATLAAKELKSLPVDYPGGTNGDDAARHVSVALSAEETRALLEDVPAAYHTRIDDVLLTALVAAYARWTGEAELLLEFERDGREEFSDGLDLSRTIGPLDLSCPVLLHLDEPFTPGTALPSIKEQLRAIPWRAIDGAMRRNREAEAPDVPETDAARALPNPPVAFSYTGRRDALLDAAPLLRPAREQRVSSPGRRERGAHLLEVEACVDGGQLRLDWSYNAALHTKTTVERLAADYLSALREIIEHCLSPGAGGHTPSDFPLTKLDRRALDALLKTTGPVADLYPLTPTQQGMLFHSLYTPETGVYMGQLSCVIEGQLDEAAFAEAWRRVVERHDSLRTSFIWENLDEPLQVVRHRVELKLDVRDWRDAPAAEQAQRLESFLSEDWADAFDLARAPLMRLALLRTAADAYRFIWTHHHLLLDGWSASLLMREVLDIYGALRRGAEPPPARARAVRDYLHWLRKQDAAKAERFWRAELEGFTAPTPLTLGSSNGGASDETPRARKQQLQLTPQETTALQSFARRHQLTLSTL